MVALVASHILLSHEPIFFKKIIFVDCYRFFFSQVKTVVLIVTFTNSHFALFLNREFRSKSTFLNTTIAYTIVRILHHITYVK